MKAILISGYHYNESIRVVEVKETEKSYMVEGKRFPKGHETFDSLSYVNGNDKWSGGCNLYKIDSQYALSKLKDKKHRNLCSKISSWIGNSSNLTHDQAKAIAEILGL